MIHRWIGSALACVVTLATLAAGGLEPLERPLVDLRLRLLDRPADPGPILIEIDPRSVHEVGRWPWPRSLHALLLDRLTAAGAGHVYLDIDFSLPSDESEDIALEAALARRQGETTLAAFRQWSTADQVYIDAGPLERFARHARAASTNLVPAADGLIRQAAGAIPWRGGILPSFAARLSGVDDLPDGDFYIDYGIDLSGVTRLSFVDVAAGKVDPALLRGRSVVVGATSVELGDILAVPLHRVLPGVVVQIYAAQSLMLDRALQRFPFWVLAVALCGFVFLLDRLARERSLVVAVTILLGGNVILWGGAVGLQAAIPVILDVVPFTLASLGASAMAFLARFHGIARSLVSENQARRRSEQFAGAVIQNAFDALVTTDGSGRINFANTAACRMFGLSQTEAQGLPLSQFVGRRGSLPIEGIIRTFRRIETTQRPRRLVCRRASGALFYAELTVSELLEDRRRLFILMLRDIDRRVKAERRLLARERELRRAKGEAEIANESKTQFLANMSHELKTSLNAIIGFSEIMEQQLLGPLGSEGYLSYAKDIRASGERLFQMVSDVLEFSRMEAGEAQVNESTFDLAGMCREMVERMTDRCSARGQVFEADIPPSEASFRGDEHLIKQALYDVLSNAAKFTPQGGSIAFSMNLDDDSSARMVVEDSGIGIAEAEIELCFEAFGQANRGLQRTFEGSGLGLTLAKRFLELHQGSIALASCPGEGTRVTMTLPAARSCGSALQQTA